MLGPDRVARYHVISELGSGGMAVIYLARSEGPGGFGRLLAVKTIHRHLCRERAFVDMFLDEARIAARIHHPNVVPVYDVGEDSGLYYIAMDYVSGETLGQVTTQAWRADREFPLEMAVYWMSMACEGLHAAHELRDAQGDLIGVVHRDVSPSNLLVGYDGTLRVTDFGVAKAAGQIAHTSPGVTKGKVAYMAPEQVRGERVDRRTDVFALGVVLWEATVGRRLFKCENDASAARRVCSGAVPAPSRLRAGYPTALERIVLKALAPNPEDRHSSARHLADELGGFLGESPTRVSVGEAERFMKDLFSQRYGQRSELERRALAYPLFAPTSANAEACDLAEPTKSDEDGRAAAAIVLREILEDIAKQESLESADVGDWGGGSFPPEGPHRRRTRMLSPPLLPRAGRRWMLSSRRAGLIGVACLGAAALILAGTFHGSFRDSTGRPTTAAHLGGPPLSPHPPGAASVVETPGTPGADPSEQDRVAISIAVTPPSAIIRVDGKPTGGTLIIPRSERTYEVEVSAPGYRSKVLRVIADRTKDVLVDLERTRKRAPARAPSDVLIGGDEL